jgi:hypothetical protein
MQALRGPSVQPQNRIVFPFHQPSAHSSVKIQTAMYEDSWYTYVPDSHKKEDVSTHSAKHRRKESLLKQTNVSPTNSSLESFTENDTGGKSNT